MELIVDKEFLLLLSSMSISTSRSGMDHTVPKPHMRWKVGDVLRFDKSAKLEPFSTIAAGNALISTGSFSTTASPFPFNTTLGRYTAVGPGCSPMGFRHPVEAVCMNSAVYNFYRENIFPYFEKYEIENGPLTKNPVPTPQPIQKPTIIGHDVWFASNISICPGVTVGTGSIIASNSVLTKDIPPYSFVAGIPAKVKKLRFPEKIVERLLASNWWDYELGDLFKNHLNFANPEEFLDKFEELKENLTIYQPRKLYPMEYTLKQKFRENLPKRFAITEHSTLFGIDVTTSIISQISSNNDFQKMEAIIPEISEGGVCKLFLPKSNRYIATISSNLKATTSSEPTYFSYEINKNGSFSLIIDGRFLSFRRAGGCSLVDWNREWEQLSFNSIFENSILT